MTRIYVSPHSSHSHITFSLHSITLTLPLRARATAMCGAPALCAAQPCGEAALRRGGVAPSEARRGYQFNSNPIQFNTQFKSNLAIRFEYEKATEAYAPMAFLLLVLAHSHLHICTSVLTHTHFRRESHGLPCTSVTLLGTLR